MPESSLLQYADPEIERRFTLDRSDAINTLEHAEDAELGVVRHIYLHDAEDELELRVSQGVNGYTATLKNKGTVERSELEVPISAQAYEAYNDSLAVVEKLVVEMDNGYEIGMFKGALSWLSLVELEFTSHEASEAFTPPDWFGTEVTDDASYNCRNLVEVPGRPEVQKYNQALIETIEQLVDDSTSPVVLGIAGPSAGGKSTLARLLANDVKNDVDDFRTTTLTIDNYIRGKSKLEAMQGGGEWNNWDVPIIYDFEQLTADIAALKQGKPIESPLYSFESGQRVGSHTIEPSPLILVEGLYSLHQDLLPHYDKTLYVDAPIITRLERRIARDVERCGWDPKEIFRYCMDVAEPLAKQHIAPQKNVADIVLGT